MPDRLTPEDIDAVAARVVTSLERSRRITREQHEADHRFLLGWRTRCEYVHGVLRRAAENAVIHIVWLALGVLALIFAGGAREAVLGWLGISA